MRTTLFAAFMLSAAVASGAETLPSAEANTPGGAIELSHSFYVRLVTGTRLVPSQDLNRQFTVGSSGPDNADFWTQDYGFSAGYQSPSPLGLELGMVGTAIPLANGAPGEYDVKYDGMVAGKTYHEYFSLFSFYLMPTLRLPAPGFFSCPSIHTLGVKIASTTLTGYSSNYLTTTNGYYNYYSGYHANFTAQTTTYEADYRLEQMLGKRFSLGLELGYCWANFTPTESDGTRSQRLDGSPLTLDLSGPRVALSLSFWILRPFVIASEDLARLRERQRARQARRRARRGDVNTNSDTAQRLVEKGDALMHEKSYDLAGALYQQAVSSDVNSRWGWQGLGNADYYQGMKDEALKAYYRAFALSEGDEKLRAMIERMKNEGAKGKP